MRSDEAGAWASWWRVGCRLLVVLGLVGGLGIAAAREAAPASADPALEARVMKLSSELRCLVCQNQTIADSHADLAVDLRNQVREMLRQGRSEAEIKAYMTDRYGDFVLYRPPLNAATAFLWFGPVALMVVGCAVLLIVLRRRRQLSPDRFEPDPEFDDVVDPDPSRVPHGSTDSPRRV